MLGFCEAEEREPKRIAMRVLVADDSEVVIERVTELLSEVDGIELAGRAGSVRETSRLLEELRPEMIILDLQMPDGNALELLEGIKAAYPESIVIVLTNSAALAVRERCLKTGADFFLDKSNEFENLPKIIREMGRTARAAPNPVLTAREAPGNKLAV
jgi:DNA-binding NarL/FixJ family response regulator